MKIKFLVPCVLALSALAVAPALAYGYYPYNEAPISGSQMTDWPSERANVTMTGSFLRPEQGYQVRRDYWAQRAYDDGYRAGYYDRYYGR